MEHKRKRAESRERDKKPVNKKERVRRFVETLEADRAARQKAKEINEKKEKEKKKNKRQK